MKDFVWNHRYPLLLGIGTFLLIFLFFSQAHPLYPYDADDWTYLYHTRGFYPSTEEYNPTRLLPEILMPLAGEFAMSIVYPFVGDITISVGITASLLLALLITAYLLLFYRMLRRVTQVSGAAGILLSFLFLAFHFLVFRIEESGNQHLFYSFDLCCQFNYTIPNLLAGCLVFLFITDRFEDVDLHSHLAQKGLLFLALLLVIFSHLFGSIILIAYLGIYLLFQAIDGFRSGAKLRPWLRRYAIHISAILLWFIALLFEANGRRADTVTEIAATPFLQSLKESARYFIQMGIHGTNHLFIGLTLLAFVSYILLSWRRREFRLGLRMLSLLLCCAAICSIYLVLMSAKSYPYYILRAMTLFAAPFFVMVAAFLGTSMLISRYPRWSALLPFLLLLVYCDIERKGNTFLDVQTLEINQQVQGVYRVHPVDILRQNRQYISTLVNADQAGLTEVNLEVQKFDHPDNWPLAYYYGKRLSRVLHKYGFIKQRAKVTIVPIDKAGVQDAATRTEMASTPETAETPSDE